MMTMAEWIEDVADNAGYWCELPEALGCHLRMIAVEVRELEAREHARLSERAYSSSPSGYGELKSGESRSTYERVETTCANARVKT
jgi:hypothetical protein